MFKLQGMCFTKSHPVKGAFFASGISCFYPDAVIEEIPKHCLCFDIIKLL